MFALACSGSPVQPLQRPQFSVVSPPQVTMIDIGTLGGAWSQAVAIDARGRVVGSSLTAGGAPHGFLWDGGSMSDLGTFIPVAMNDAGRIAGNSGAYPGQGHAFIWDGGTLSDLGTLGGGASWATAMNGRGQVVGTSSTVTGQWHAFIWDGGTMRDLGVLPGDDWIPEPESWWSQATGINARGQVVGFTAGFLASEELAFLWDGTTMRGLGTLGGADSHAFAINERGDVVGQAALPNGTCYDYEIQCHAFLWRNGTMLDLGSLGGASVALAINGRGQVAGWSNLSRDYLPHAVVWTVAGTVATVTP